MSHRAQRVGEEIRKVLSEYLIRGLKEHLPGFVTISQVEINKDLSVAKVYYSVFGSEDDVENTKRILEEEKKSMRYEVGKKVRLRITPELALVYDHTAERASRIDTLLREGSRSREE